MTEAGMFFEKVGRVWDTLDELERRLVEAGLDYVVIGGLALNAYNYPRQTIAVDIVLTPADFERFKDRFAGEAYRSRVGRVN